MEFSSGLHSTAAAVCQVGIFHSAGELRNSPNLTNVTAAGQQLRSFMEPSRIPPLPIFQPHSDLIEVGAELLPLSSITNQVGLGR